MNTPNDEIQAPHVAVNAQYIKDLSFENPLAPSSLASLSERPHIDLSLDLKAQPLPEDNFYEVEISIEATAEYKDGVLFVVDLKYAGIFNLINILPEHKEAVLAVHCPNVIFPFARKIIADVTQDGGFQPLMIDPIDFAALYYKKLADNKSQN